MMSDHPNELGSLKKAQSPSAPEPTPKKAKSARTRAREFAVQALYQRIVGGCDLPTIHKTVGALFGFHKADRVFFDAILTGVISQAAQLDELIAPYLDRPMSEISPVEHVVLWIGAYELQNCLDVPWRVVLNETVELTKIFGGPDGHKYVNGVLNQLAHSLRPVEIKAQ